MQHGLPIETNQICSGKVYRYISTMSAVSRLDQENNVSVKRVVPNISSNRIEESVEFYTTLLGFHVAMDMGWIVTLTSPTNPSAQISIVRREETLAVQENVTLTIEVENVDDIHANAVSRGLKILYPLTTESWGVRRFHVSDPNGVIINVMSHL